MRRTKTFRCRRRDGRCKHDNTIAFAQDGADAFNLSVVCSARVCAGVPEKSQQRRRRSESAFEHALAFRGRGAKSQ